MSYDTVETRVPLGLRCDCVRTGFYRVKASSFSLKICEVWQIYEFLKRLNRESLYDPGILPLGIDPKEVITETGTDICTPLFTTA